MDPPIVHFDEFMTGEECDAFIEAGKPGLQPSTGTGNLQANGKFERTKIEGRTSYNAWCMAPSDCPTLPIIRQIDLRIANITGFSYRNMEYYQILRYRGKQEYQVHSDWIDQQAAQPSGPRVFTFCARTPTPTPTSSSSSSTATTATTTAAGPQLRPASL